MSNELWIYGEHEDGAWHESLPEVVAEGRALAGKAEATLVLIVLAEDEVPPLDELGSLGVEKVYLARHALLSRQSTDARAAALVLAAAIGPLSSDLVLCGRRASGGETGWVPAVLPRLLTCFAAGASIAAPIRNRRPGPARISSQPPPHTPRTSPRASPHVTQALPPVETWHATSLQQQASHSAAPCGPPCPNRVVVKTSYLASAGGVRHGPASLCRYLTAVLDQAGGR